jgi:hypothetical protein
LGGLIAYSFMDSFPGIPGYVHKLGKADLTKIVLSKIFSRNSHYYF